LSVKKNPQNPLYTQLGVLTKGTIMEVNVSELGLVTTSGKVVWGKWAQVTNVYVFSRSSRLFFTAILTTSQARE
jgi:hypothetical protein